MAGNSPAKKQARSSRAAAEKKARETAGADSPASLSPTAEALKALKKLASPAAATGLRTESNTEASNQTDPENDGSSANALRIQAPAIRGSSSRSSGAATSSGPATISPAGSGHSAPTSPADDGLDTPDSRDAGPSSKRPRLADASSGATTPTTPPLFLEKTYEMLEKCSPQVACWSHTGDSFIVKNPVAFAEHVIPIYFKHKNFSSFVRQLNFYGFRKVRVVDPDVTGGVDPKDWWEFRHDKFQRGQKALLKEIKRRSLPSTSSGSNGTAAGGGGAAGAHDAAVATVDRAEIDELRTEVATLREQIQTLNKHMFSVMQIMMTRNAPATPSATPTPTSMGGAQGLAYSAQHLGLPSHHHQHPHHHYHQQQQPHAHPTLPPTTPHGMPSYPFVGSLPPAHLMAGSSATTNKHDKHQRGPAVPASPAMGGGGPGATYALRPIQSFVGTPGYAYPVTPSADAGLDWDAYSRHAFHVAQAAHAQAAATAAAAAAAASNAPPQPQPQLTRGGSGSAQPSSATTGPVPASSVPAVPGLKRARSQQKRSPTEAAGSSATASTPKLENVNPVENPEAAVRQLSMQVSQIRADLLQSILTRTLTFIRAQPSAATSSAPSASPEIDVIASSIGRDIQQRLAQINEAEAATHGRPRGGTSETSHMYRVEMLKFVSKELPRAMSEAVEKRLPAATKKALNRSLLALMVQKAQAALEAQMRVETASTAGSPSSSSTSTNGK